MDELNDRQQAFCIEYIKDYNGTQAVIRAGYSKNGAAVTANRLLNNPKICDAIREAFETNVMSVSEIKSILTDIARGRVKDADVNNRINALKELGKIFQLTTTMRVETWQDDAINLIKTEQIGYRELVETVKQFGESESLAEELFIQAGVSIETDS